jgi:hypothetical protein
VFVEKNGMHGKEACRIRKQDPKNAKQYQERACATEQTNQMRSNPQLTRWIRLGTLGFLVLPGLKEDGDGFGFGGEE